MITISFWLTCFKKDFKNNIYLYLMLCVVLILTFGLWYYGPLYIFTVYFPYAKIVLFPLWLGIFFTFSFKGEFKSFQES